MSIQGFYSKKQEYNSHVSRQRESLETFLLCFDKSAYGNTYENSDRGRFS